MAWKEGDIDGLLEATAIQRLNPLSHSSSEPDISRKFAQYMKMGNVKAAERLLSEEHKCGLLSLNESIPEGPQKCVQDILKDRHPNPAPLLTMPSRMFWKLRCQHSIP